MVATLTYGVAGGMLAVLCTARLDQIAWRFLRIVAVIVLALGAGTVAWGVRESGFRWGVAAWPLYAGCVLSVCAAAALMLAPVAAERAGLFRATVALGGIGGLAGSGGLALGLSSPIAASGSGLAPLMIVLGQVVGGLFLGGITISWLLGHAYLTATRMTIAPLRHFTNLLTWALIGRCTFLVLSVGLLWMLGPPIGEDANVDRSLGALFYQSWLILLLRVGVGLVAVGVFVWMVRDCVRLRSTQSATGILYFGSVFAYVGELAAQQLLHEWGWPV